MSDKKWGGGPRVDVKRLMLRNAKSKIYGTSRRGEKKSPSSVKGVHALSLRLFSARRRLFGAPPPWHGSLKFAQRLAGPARSPLRERCGRAAPRGRGGEGGGCRRAGARAAARGREEGPGGWAGKVFDTPAGCAARVFFCFFFVYFFCTGPQCFSGPRPPLPQEGRSPRPARGRGR